MPNNMNRYIAFRLLSQSPESLRSFADTAPRKDLIAYCVWNDPNGVYTDKDSNLEFGHITSTETLREIVRMWAHDHETGVT